MGTQSTQRELSNEYHHDRDKMVFKYLLRCCALDESILSIGRVKVTVKCYTAKKSDMSIILLNVY